MKNFKLPKAFVCKLCFFINQNPSLLKLQEVVYGELQLKYDGFNFIIDLGSNLSLWLNLSFLAIVNTILVGVKSALPLVYKLFVSKY